MKTGTSISTQNLARIAIVTAVLPLILLMPPRCQAADLFGPVEDYFANWFNRVDQIQSEQPHWMTPLVTVTPRLEEEYRYDQLWQTQPHGSAIDNFGGSKGLELIPCDDTEIILGVPGWIAHNGKLRHSAKSTAIGDGWADENFLVKIRLLSANEEQGNYIVT